MDKYTQRLQKIEAVLTQKLPQTYDSPWKEQTFGTLSDCIGDAHFDALIPPCRDLLSLGGKRWRPLLLVLCAELFCDSDSPLLTAAYNAVPIVEFVHTASLIHDDIEDGADMRRGKPAAHLTYGLDTALNAGSWLYFNAYTAIDTLTAADSLKLSLSRMLGLELRRLHLGQAMDISWHRTPKKMPTADEYDAMVRLKTGTLASLAAKTGSLCGGGTEAQAAELGTIAAEIGVGFQILDDAINLSKGNPGKKRGDDIVEGKKSWPLLVHLGAHPEDAEQIAACFEDAKANGIESPAVEQCIGLLTKSGAVQTAFEYSAQMIRHACDTVCRLYPNRESARLISDLFMNMLKKV